MRTAGAFLFLSVLVGACAVGDEAGPVDTDDRDEILGILCNAEYDVTGSFVASTPARPADMTGCWPVGTWTFTATVRSNECGAAPSQLEGSYSFRVDRTIDPDPTQDLGWIETYAYLGNQANLHRLKVSEGGGAECEGGLELYNADGTEFWNFKPSLGGTTIGGFAEYAKYDADQRNPDPTEL